MKRSSTTRAAYSNFERLFAEFLDRVPDVLRFRALGTTEQGASSAMPRVGYLKPSGGFITGKCPSLGFCNAVARAQGHYQTNRSFSSLSPCCPMGQAPFPWFSAARGVYYPDWVAVQRDLDGKNINWMIETKGRVWEGAGEKDAVIEDWCRRMGETKGDVWKYIRVNQAEFRDDFESFRAMLFEVVATEMFRKREARDTTLSHEEFLRWRDEGRREWPS